MRVYRRILANEPIEIRYVESATDTAEAERDLASMSLVSYDTETTGPDIYSSDARLRLVQLGDDRTAYVFDAARHRDWLREFLSNPRLSLVCHNAGFDLLVADHFLGVPLESLGPRVHDTYIEAHLLDSRRRSEGGIGLGLKELAVALIDEHADDGKRDLHEVFRRELGVKQAEGWAAIPTDHPVYVAYSGLDPILTTRIHRLLWPKVEAGGFVDLYDFERRLQLIVAAMERRGVLIDVPYVQDLRVSLYEDAERAARIARRYGVDTVDSPRQVAAALAAMGEQLTERTASGQPRVDKAVLLTLADLDRTGERIGAREPNALAEAVITAKRARKWAVAYAEAFLELRDDNDRLHSQIGALRARTGRMAISRPPLQQLPSSDWRIRRALIADPGHVLIAADYAQIELRVLAALAQEPRMIEAIRAGRDLHGFTAELVFGPDYTKAQRKLMKGVGFGKVYGGGAHTLARQTGISVQQAQHASDAYDRVFPRIKQYSSHLELLVQNEHRISGQYAITTPSGRRLLLDRDRMYSVVNYVIQSTARDIFAEALVRLDDCGMSDILLLPIHDELLAQAPVDKAEEVAREMARVMGTDFYGVPIEAEWKIVGKSWGHAYGAPNETEDENG